MTARVSVVVPCYNGAAYVGEAIASALNQTFRDLTVIVVNDGSTDRFEEAIEPYRTKVTLINQRNLGLSAARNAAIRASDSEFIAYLDADDSWLPAKLEHQVRLLEAQRSCALVHTGVQFVGSKGQLLERQKPYWYDPTAVTLDNILHHNIITVSSVLQRRSTLDDELFAQDLSACEDWDMWIRVLQRGGVIAYIPDDLTFYRIHESNLSAQSIKMTAATVAVMERLCASSPGSPAAETARRLCRHYTRQLGHLNYDEGNFALAARHFLSALSGTPIRDFPRVAKSVFLQFR